MGKGGEHHSTIGIRRDMPDLCEVAPTMIRLHLELPDALVALKEPYKLDNFFLSKSQFPQSQ